MAKTKSGANKKRRKGNREKDATKKPKATPESLLAQATALVQTSQADEAIIHARRALALLQPSGDPTPACLPALMLLGEISIELGDVEAAREYFTAAAVVDPDGNVPDGNGGGAEKFMWLAQLCEDGGEESVQWFERGADVLRRDMGELEDRSEDSEVQLSLQEKGRRLGNALCGIAEVYMTDLSYGNPNSTAGYR